MRVLLILGIFSLCSAEVTYSLGGGFISEGSHIVNATAEIHNNNFGLSASLGTMILSCAISYYLKNYYESNLVTYINLNPLIPQAGLYYQKRSTTRNNLYYKIGCGIGYLGLTGEIIPVPLVAFQLRFDSFI